MKLARDLLVFTLVGLVLLAVVEGVCRLVLKLWPQLLTSGAWFAVVLIGERVLPW